MGISTLKSALNIMVPILFAASGGLFPALAGTLNIALEGTLLMGAFSSLTVFYFTGNVALAVGAAALSAMALCALQAFAAFKLRANIFICGLAVNLLSSGLCVIFSDKIFNTKGVVVARNALSSGLANRYLLLAFFLLAVSCLVIYKTPFGYRLRSCEKSGEALISLGMNPRTYNAAALLISGFFCGIGGSFLSLNLGAFTREMSAGKGWIALVIIFLGGGKPMGILLAAFIFSLAESVSIHAQGIWDAPSELILAFPYVCALLALIVKRSKW